MYRRKYKPLCNKHLLPQNSQWTQHKPVCWRRCFLCLTCCFHRKMCGICPNPAYVQKGVNNLCLFSNNFESPIKINHSSLSKSRCWRWCRMLRFENLIILIQTSWKFLLQYSEDQERKRCYCLWRTQEQANVVLTSLFCLDRCADGHEWLSSSRDGTFAYICWGYVATKSNSRWNLMAITYNSPNFWNYIIYPIKIFEIICLPCRVQPGLRKMHGS